MAGPEYNLRRRFHKLAALQGWLVWGQKASAYSGPGRPDDVLCVEGYFIAPEWKTATGAARATQFRRMEQVKRAGGLAFIARDPEEAVRFIRAYVNRRHQMAFDMSAFMAKLNNTPTESEGPVPETIDELQDIAQNKEPDVSEDVKALAAAATGTEPLRSTRTVRHRRTRAEMDVDQAAASGPALNHRAQHPQPVSLVEQDFRDSDEEDDGSHAPSMGDLVRMTAPEDPRWFTPDVERSILNLTEVTVKLVDRLDRLIEKLTQDGA